MTRPPATAGDPGGRFRLGAVAIRPDETITVEYDEAAVDLTRGAAHGAGAVILTKDGRILLQQRDDKVQAGLPLIAHFGGGLHACEGFVDGLRRELAEELGARIDPGDLIWLGARIAVTPAGGYRVSGDYFWHDREGSIEGCFEGSPAYFDSAAEALARPNLSSSVVWSLGECIRRGLLR